MTARPLVPDETIDVGIVTCVVMNVKDGGVYVVRPTGSRGVSIIRWEGTGRLRIVSGDELRAAQARALAAVDRFVRDVGFTAPELLPVRYRQLREAVADAFIPEDPP